MAFVKIPAVFLLAATGLYLQHARRSAEGRLGIGKDTRAARAEGRPWTAEPIDARFHEAQETQVQRAFAALAHGLATRPVGGDLLFLRGEVLGCDREARHLGTASHRMRLLAPHLQPELPGLHNLRLLARAPGCPLRCIARLRPGAAGTATLLAIAPDAEPAADLRLALPEGMTSVPIGIHELARANLPGAGARPVACEPVAGAFNDGLDDLRRRLGAIAQSGRHGVPQPGSPDVTRGLARLQRDHCPIAAALLHAMITAAYHREAHIAGARFPEDSTDFAAAWLAAAGYLEAATLAAQREAWLA